MFIAVRNIILLFAMVVGAAMPFRAYYDYNRLRRCELGPSTPHFTGEEIKEMLGVDTSRYYYVAFSTRTQPRARAETLLVQGLGAENRYRMTDTAVLLQDNSCRVIGNATVTLNLTAHRLESDVETLSRNLTGHFHVYVLNGHPQHGYVYYFHMFLSNGRETGGSYIVVNDRHQFANTWMAKEALEIMCGTDVDVDQVYHAVGNYADATFGGCAD